MARNRSEKEETSAIPLQTEPQRGKEEMEFTRNGSQGGESRPAASAGKRKVYYVDGEELEEVPDDEELDVMEADDADADNEDVEDNVEETVEESENAIMEDEAEEVVDQATYLFAGHKDSVYCVAVHPTIPGLVATGGGDDRAFLWKVPQAGAAPEPPLELSGHTDTVTSIGFNFNGNLLLTGAYDGTVRIWQVSSGDCLQILEGPEDVEWASWHSKGNAVIAGSKDGTIWMWLAHNGQCMMVFSGHDGLVSSGVFSADGKVVCSGGEDGTVRLWQPRTGVCSHVFENTQRSKDGHEAMVTCMRADGELILTGSMDGTARLFHCQNNRLLNIFQHSQARVVDEEEEEVAGVECVAFSAPNFHWVSTGGGDHTLKIWDTNANAARVVCTHQGSVVACQWHSTLPLVVTAALDRMVRVWDGRNGRCCIELSGHTDLIVSLALATIPASEQESTSLDGKADMIVSVSDDHTARVFVLDFAALASSV